MTGTYEKIMREKILAEMEEELDKWTQVLEETNGDTINLDTYLITKAILIIGSSITAAIGEAVK
tara:strand:+ start:1255 stop:1446 length:192 start_codon:yes stop_codon:yes gene_type:complete